MRTAADPVRSLPLAPAHSTRGLLPVLHVALERGVARPEFPGPALQPGLALSASAPPARPQPAGPLGSQPPVCRSPRCSCGPRPAQWVVRGGEGRGPRSKENVNKEAGLP